MMADTDIYDCCTSTRGFTDTLSNFAISKTYSYLTPKLWKETVLTKSPYQEFTDRLVKTCTSLKIALKAMGRHYLLSTYCSELRHSKMATEKVELHKLKLAELKQECLAHGLETEGIKQDLINRLQACLEERAEEEANEEDVLGDETEEEEPKPTELPVKEEEPPEKTVDVASEKKVVKITSGIPQTDRMQKRAEPFNVPVSLERKKAARAARVGISSVPTKGLSSDTKPMVTWIN
ncbi:SAP domain-containing ribonucleoprotein [Microtus ochrogaster]|uniref:SAP domain-containing ribonucleoprotein n=1 Tax=Microtus ochrogaster TaxID=79684 RepID=A0A8J6G1Z2_MICOH|nr:SAP domain-containing ribonucleoprotein [Microtus ochrogaster]